MNRITKTKILTEQYLQRCNEAKKKFTYNFNKNNKTDSNIDIEESSHVGQDEISK